MSPLTALSFVALLLLALALGWRSLALNYGAKLRARRPAPPTVWLLECRPRDDEGGHVVGVFATKPLAEAGLEMHLASGHATGTRPQYALRETLVFYAGDWLPPEKSLCQTAPQGES